MKKPIVVTFAHALTFHNFISIFTELALNPERTVIAVIDCYFVKSEKTEGKAYFYKSIAAKPEHELEISVIYLVEVETRLSSSLSFQKTPSLPQTKISRNPQIVAHRNRAKKLSKK